MRLWSIHPKYLDAHGLLGLWREGLLAQKVLLGETRGYKNHPQLIRFKRTSDPVLYIGTYLYYVYLEGVRRGYSFNKEKIVKYDLTLRMPVTEGQINYEFRHLLEKLKIRNPKMYAELLQVKITEVNPIFFVIKGDVEEWEKVAFFNTQNAI
ncbi:pyrimidine dimer DNA glycosylase [Acidianus hospitalis W1]|uniref:Pyrimidine dimer DNA glycosylase n=1 Tax=Acidianus hospitalis (strain W1) TaxID=933801 RepID=F4B799_ACIHW|nr:pyrimidine dimer DNA glycosylase/endonuclease V [Acidianus hospitalis]AEE94719.1 pyrimidine dimer DNA glycosylase [Acidianus hospitalis W1]